MTNALSITEVGMINSMNHLNLIANNLANANTAGFKRDISVSQPFSDFLAQGIRDIPDVKLGSEQPVVKQVVDQSSGALSFTGNRLDVAIEGEGFFALTTPNGTAYTRQGSFTLDASGALVTANGYRVNGQGGDIRLTSDQPRIDKQGVIWDGDQQAGRLKIMRFANLDSLEKVGAGLYLATAAVAEPDSDAVFSVRQGYVEASNVNVMSEMVDLMSIMRQIESNQKVLRGYDEMMDVAIRTISDI